MANNTVLISQALSIAKQNTCNSCNPAERGYIVSKKAFLSKKSRCPIWGDGIFLRPHGDDRTSFVTAGSEGVLRSRDGPWPSPSLRVRQKHPSSPRGDDGCFLCQSSGIRGPHREPVHTLLNQKCDLRGGRISNCEPYGSSPNSYFASLSARSAIFTREKNSSR